MRRCRCKCPLLGGADADTQTQTLDKIVPEDAPTMPSPDSAPQETPQQYSPPRPVPEYLPPAMTKPDYYPGRRVVLPGMPVQITQIPLTRNRRGTAPTRF